MTRTHVLRPCGFLSLAIVVALLSGAALAQSAADPMPTPDDLSAMATAKKWTDLLKATTRVLALKGPAAAGFDRTQVWMQKAEAQLQSNQYIPASQSFEKAAAEKDAKPEQADLAMAYAAVAKKSDRKGYMPPHSAANPHPEAIDVLDITKRKDAVAAMLDSELDALTSKIEKSKKASDARTLIDLAKQAHTLAAMDRVVNGSATKTEGLQTAIAKNFTDSATTWSDDALRQVEDLNTIASKTTQLQQRDRNGNVYMTVQKAGLNSTQKNQLTGIQKDAKELAGTLQAIEGAMDAAGKTSLQAAKPVIQRVYDRADVVAKDAAQVSPTRAPGY